MTLVHGAGGAPRQAQVPSAVRGRGNAAAILSTGMNSGRTGHSCPRSQHLGLPGGAAGAMALGQYSIALSYLCTAIGRKKPPMLPRKLVLQLCYRCCAREKTPVLTVETDRAEDVSPNPPLPSQSSWWKTAAWCVCLACLSCRL